MAQIFQGATAVSESRLREGTKVVPIWAPIGGLGFANFPDVIHSMHRLCEIAEIANISPEFQNERDLFSVGKKRSTVNDGAEWPLTLTAEGNALELQAALAKLDMHKYPVVPQGQTYIGAGHMFLLSADDNETIQFSGVIPNCDVQFTEMPGATDGTSQMTIEIRSRSTPYRTGRQLIPIHEVWFAGTSPIDGSTVITNAEAPDGTLTEFRLGSGNGSGLTNRPLAVAFNQSLAGQAGEYLLEVRVNESVVSNYTYNSTTGVITFATAPADGAKLEAVYFVRGGADAWDSAYNYGVGTIVGYNGAYYISDANAAAGTTPDGTTPWLVYDGFGRDGANAAGVGTPVIPQISGVTNMFESWNDLQKR